jgi:HEAT repeat protein
MKILKESEWEIALGWGKLVDHKITLNSPPAFVTVRDYAVRFWAASTLGKIGHARALPALRKAQRDRNEGVRIAVESALHQVRSKGPGRT